MPYFHGKCKKSPDGKHHWIAAKNTDLPDHDSHPRQHGVTHVLYCKYCGRAKKLCPGVIRPRKAVSTLARNFVRKGGR